MEHIPAIELGIIGAVLLVAIVIYFFKFHHDQPGNKIK
jgi:hypothetical protein